MDAKEPTNRIIQEVLSETFTLWVIIISRIVTQTGVLSYVLKVWEFAFRSSRTHLPLSTVWGGQRGGRKHNWTEVEGWTSKEIGLNF